MTATAPFSGSKISSAHGKHGAIAVKYLANSSDDHAAASRRWFAGMLWRAFPAPSEGDLSLRAAQVLDVSPRQVRNWLRCENDASLRYVMAVVALAGAEIVFSRIEGS